MSLTSLLREQVVFRLKYLRTLLDCTKKALVSDSNECSSTDSEFGRPHSKRANIFLLFVAILFYSVDSLCGLLTWVYLFQTNNRKYCDEFFVDFTFMSVNVTKNGTQWLMGSPAGLKLNTPLTLFLGGHILGILEAWKMSFETLVLGEYREEFFASVWMLFGLLSVLGISVQISLLLDVMKISVGYILAFYNIFALLYSVQVSTLFALLRLFLGKKWNPLRQRVDSYEYDSSQLTIGTLLLSMSVFLFPTIGVYYLLFVSLKLLSSAPRSVGRVFIVTLNRLTVLPLLLFAEWLTFKLSRVKIDIREYPLTQQQQQQQSASRKTEHTVKMVDVKLTHQMFEGKSLNIKDFQWHLHSLKDSTIVKEYFTKQRIMEKLPASINKLSALYYVESSIVSRIMYVFKCTLLGVIFDF